MVVGDRVEHASGKNERDRGELGASRAGLSLIILSVHQRCCTRHIRHGSAIRARVHTRIRILVDLSPSPDAQHCGQGCTQLQ